MGLASSEPNRLKFQFAELRQFEVHTVYGQTQRRINVGDYREIFDDIFPNKASKLRGSYSRCKRPGLDQGSRSGLWCGLFLRHVHVRFDCAGSYKTRDPMLTLIICAVNSFINSSCDMSMFTSTAEARNLGTRQFLGTFSQKRALVTRFAQAPTGLRHGVLKPWDCGIFIVNSRVYGLLWRSPVISFQEVLA